MNRESYGVIDARTFSLYLLFILVSVLFNLGTQWVTVRLISGEIGVYLGLVLGTGIGLVTKYLLDKRYIFNFYSGGFFLDIKKFLLYASMGLITTAIFWTFELAFHYIFSSELMKNVGAIIGLSIGYFIKYFLDRRLVFKRDTQKIPAVPPSK